jgi:hypothetical protein
MPDQQLQGGNKNHFNARLLLHAALALHRRTGVQQSCASGTTAPLSQVCLSLDTHANITLKNKMSRKIGVIKISVLRTAGTAHQDVGYSMMSTHTMFQVDTRHEWQNGVGKSTTETCPPCFHISTAETQVTWHWQP